MPRVPPIDSFGVSPDPLPTARQSSNASPDAFGGVQARQQQELAHGIATAAGAIDRMQAQAQSEADQVRIDDALNQLRQRSLTLTYDPEQGYANRKGVRALAADDVGLPLPDSYSAKLSKSRDEIANALSTPRQQRQFLMHANELVTNFRGGAQAHMLRESKSHADSVMEGTIKIGTETALASWNDRSDTGLRQEGINSVKSAIAKRGQLNGESASETVARMKVAESGIHRDIVEAALSNNSPDYAVDYFSTHRAEMTAADVLKLQGTVNENADVQGAQTAAAGAVRGLASRFAPDEMDRLRGVFDVRMADVDANDTAAAGNAQFDRVLQGFVTKYGDAAKAIAAMGASEGEVDAAIAKASSEKRPADWLSFLPANIQADVADKFDRYVSGQGAPKPPTELEFVDAALANLPANARQRLVKLTREEASRQYKAITEDRKQRGDELEKEAMQALVANRGDFMRLDARLKTELVRFDPQTYAKVEKFAKEIGNQDPPTEWDRYYQLRQEAMDTPAVFAKRNLLADFPRLGKAQREALIDLQQKANDPGAMAEVATLEQQLASMHRTLGWGNGDGEKKGAFDGIVRRAIMAAQRDRGGKSLNDEERQKIIDRMVIEGEVPGRVAGNAWTDTRRFHQVVGTLAEEDFMPAIPEAQRELIEKELKRAGRPINDDQVMQLLVPEAERQRILAALGRAKKPADARAVMRMYLLAHPR